MFGKKKPPPTVAVKITTTRTRKGKTDVVTTQAMELEPIELPEDPVALVKLYSELRPQYENALEVTNQLAATMNQIADRVAEVSEGEIALKRVGTPTLDPRSSRIEQAKRMAAGLQESDGYATAASRIGVSFPKAQAGLPFLNHARPAGQYNSQPATAELDEVYPPETVADLYPGSEQYWTPDQTWQAQTPTPVEAVMAAGSYVPPQGQISGSEKPENQRPNASVEELRVLGRDQAEAGLQQRIQGVFANVSQQSIAAAPTIQMPMQ